jgi:hypothetical protein
VILVKRSGKGKRRVRGPFAFDNDVLRCGASTLVACVQLKGANVTISNSQLLFPESTIHESVYNLVKSSTAAFVSDVVQGYGQEGRVSHNSSVHIQGGAWTSHGQIPNGP